MSLKQKITFSFFLSATIIAILAAFEYINFIEIRSEIRNIEITDTVRSKSLQLRRHEKNFFLYPAKADEESKAIYSYLTEMDILLSDKLKIGRIDKASLRKQISEYRRLFFRIESLINELSGALKDTGASYSQYRKFYPLIELTFREQPLQAIAFLKEVFLLPEEHMLLARLKTLDSEITALRKTGEDILIISKELDKAARDNVENTIHISQVAILVFFPLFFISGIGTLFYISKNVVARLKLLINVVEKTGKGDFFQIPVPSQKDEVGVLIRKFNSMEEQLSQRERELDKKNKELHQSKKLAAIGTLASGVAHELNNPLNNIHISAQVLVKEAGDSCSPITKETVNDILGQTIRVKQIVGDLLEFARGKDTVPVETDIEELIRGAYKLVSTAINTEKINLTIDTDTKGIKIFADHEQMQRVFINLFNNAVETMSGEGDLSVKIAREMDTVKIAVSDTGGGVPADDVEKIFEPFYTTKAKGTGLGLAIVFKIIKKHNGTIDVESIEGKGTTFTITLPLGEKQA